MSDWMSEVMMSPVLLMLPSIAFLLICAPTALVALECEALTYEIEIGGLCTFCGDGRKADAMTLAGDWRAVGDDMRRVLMRTRL